MGINKESDIAANLQIGPTSLGMVRIYVEGEGIELPLDFEPEEAIEIAEEIRLAAERAREMGASPKSRQAEGDGRQGRGPAGKKPGGKPQRG